jgi:hypothetical protein
MRLLPLLLICLALGACASPRWVNPRNSGADLQADLAACEKDVMRAAHLEQRMALPGSCAGAHCAAQEEQQRLQATAGAVAAHKRCMALRGWRQD